MFQALLFRPARLLVRATPSASRALWRPFTTTIPTLESSKSSQDIDPLTVTSLEGIPDPYAYEHPDAEPGQQEYPEKKLGRHEKDVYTVTDETLAYIRDHGYRFGLHDEDVEETNELIKRALSTVTASIPEMRKFRRSEIVNKWSPEDEFDTGSSRVQGMHSYSPP